MGFIGQVLPKYYLAPVVCNNRVSGTLMRFGANLVAAAESAQRKPLTDEEIMSHEWILSAEKRYEDYTMQEIIFAVGAVDFARAIEQAHNIKEGT